MDKKTRNRAYHSKFDDDFIKEMNVARNKKNNSKDR